MRFERGSSHLPLAARYRRVSERLVDGRHAARAKPADCSDSTPKAASSHAPSTGQRLGDRDTSDGRGGHWPGPVTDLGDDGPGAGGMPGEARSDIGLTVSLSPAGI